MTIARLLNPKNDIAFKKIFGSEKHKNILIHFLNDILHLEGQRAILDVEFLNPVQDPDIASKKMSAVDVLCSDGHGTRYIVEMQVSPVEGFEKRAQYYASKAYARQLNKGKEEAGQYPFLKPVIFIAITDYTLFQEKHAYHSHHKILDQTTQEWDLKDISFVFLELGKFNISDVSQLKTMVEKWCYFFKHAEDITPEELQRLKQDAIIGDALEALFSFNWTENELDLYDQEIKRVWDNAAVEAYKIKQAEAKIKQEVEAQIKQVEAQAKVQGRTEGKAEGKAEGKTEGKIERNYEIAQLMKAKGKSLEEIQEFTELSAEEIEGL